MVTGIGTTPTEQRLGAAGHQDLWDQNTEELLD